MKSSLCWMFLVLSMSFLVSAEALAQKTVHNVWANKPIALVDGETGAAYSSANGGFTGAASMSWRESTRAAVFHARAKVRNAAGTKDDYDFTLVGVSKTDVGSIEGFWDIKRNNILVCKGCVGKAYGLNLGAGSYFKLYAGTDSQVNTQKWHFSAYIAKRFDH